MKINRNNYEVWFLDFYEGRLTFEQETELMAFLDLHYDLKEEFDCFENVSLPPAKKIVFESKDILKKNTIIPAGNINEWNFAEIFIAFYEGDLSSEEKANVLLFVEKNPSLKKDFELFSKTRCEADKKIVFVEKEMLKANSIIESGSINKQNYQEFFIGALEGDLNIEQHKELKIFLELNPYLQGEYKMFAMANVTADQNVVFDRKELLRKPMAAFSASKVRYIYYAVSVAASILILLTVFFMMNKKDIQKVNMAFRNMIEWNRGSKKENRQQQEDLKVPLQYATHQHQQFAAVTDTTPKNEILYKESLYASGRYVELIRNNSPEELTGRNACEELYALMQQGNDNHSAHENNSKEGFMSLREFALFKAKKAVVSEDKKDKVTPETKITGWDLAQSGVEKAGKLTGTGAKLSKDKNDKGFRLTIGNNFELASR